MDIRLNKIENSILFFANKSCNRIERMRLMKLLWLSDRLHLNKYGRLILNDRYKALQKGPIASTALNFSKFGIPGSINVDKHYVKSVREFKADLFSKSDLKIMDYVWEKFKDMTSFEFSEYSHKYPEWRRFEKELKAEHTPDAYDIVIQDFFEFPELKEFEDILDPETIELSKEDFNVKNSIQSALK
jgi:uncharacterized phage-associated protein